MGTAADGGEVVEPTSTPGRTYPPAFDVHTATACMCSCSRSTSHKPSPYCHTCPVHTSPPHSNTFLHLLPPPPPDTTTTIIRKKTQVMTNRPSNQRQRQTTLVLNCCNHGTDPSLEPTQRPALKRVPLSEQKQAPQTMSPHSWGTSFRWPKRACESGP